MTSRHLGKRWRVAVEAGQRGVRQGVWCFRNFKRPTDLVFALTSMFRWHVLGRRDAESSQSRSISLPSGHMFEVRPFTSDFEVLRKVLLGDQYSAALSLLEPRAVIIDLGANIGASACLFLEAISDATVVAVEPDCENVRLLKANVSRFGSRCIVEQCAAAGERGLVELTPSLQPWAIQVREVSVEQRGSDNLVAAKSIPEIIESAGLGDRMLDLVKCDIEGAERSLFKHASAASWLRKTKLLAVELHGDYRVPEFLQDLRRHSVEPVILDCLELGDASELTVRLALS